MFNYSQAYYQLVGKLQPLYDVQEAQAIAHEVMHEITGQDKLQRLMDKDKLLTEEQEIRYGQMEAELIAGRPLQYVLGYAWFMGKRYKVNEQVLIPRPETEELVAWIIDDAGSVNTQLNILDIGTGSGCIPIALKQALSAAAVTSCDISKGALAVAKENAANMNAGMEFIQTDFLDDTQWQLLGMYDVIVSNPPYIPIAEKDGLHANVRAYEPATALFVADDALVFYKAIASFGRQHLNSSGSIYCELHRDYAVATKALFEEQGYAVELRKDMHGNWRMLKAIFA